jgi:pilus assembly protein Flp/PilA
MFKLRIVRYSHHSSVYPCRQAFSKDASGATAVEYSLVAGLVSIAVATAVTLVGSKILSLFESVAQRWP